MRVRRRRSLAKLSSKDKTMRAMLPNAKPAQEMQQQ